MFLLEAPSEAGIQRLLGEHTGPEIIHVVGRALYIFYGDGMGTSKLTNNLLERKLGTLGTGRNWNTVQKLVALAQKS